MGRATGEAKTERRIGAVRRGIATDHPALQERSHTMAGVLESASHVRTSPVSAFRRGPTGPAAARPGDRHPSALHHTARQPSQDRIRIAGRVVLADFAGSLWYRRSVSRRDRVRMGSRSGGRRLR